VIDAPAPPAAPPPPVAVSPTVLPRARALTDALLAPAGPVVDEQCAHELRSRVAAAVAGHLPRGAGRRTVNAYALRRVRGSHPPSDSPFRWAPRTARRALGLAAVRACVAGDGRTPVEAVRRAVDEEVAVAERGAAGPRAVGTWLASLPAGGRAMVAAEAVTWATALFGALEWDRLGLRARIGGPDRWWDAPGGWGLTLQGRAEVRTESDGHPVLLCVGNGRPVDSSRVELLLPALVEVLHDPRAPAPSRVVGWWPASGRTLVVPVDARGLRETAEAVGRAATVVGPS
jgi:hypothetical protein